MPKYPEMNIPGAAAKYRKMDEFNGYVLAVSVQGSYGSIIYSTWKRVGPDDFAQSRFFSGDNDAVSEQRAMRDFCVRSGFIRSCDLLANDNLPEVSGLVDRLMELNMSSKDKELLRGLRGQIDEIMHKPKEMVVNKDDLVESQEHGDIPEPDLDLEI